jgi:hypothetical protein
MRRETQEEWGRPEEIHAESGFPDPGEGDRLENSRLRNLSDGQTS